MHLIKLLLVSLLSLPASAMAQSLWEVSPLNWDNSPLNWENSPHNWDNSIVSSKGNGVYDGVGRQIGYVTSTPSGGTNVYLNNGHRLGYIQPDQEDRPVRADSFRVIDSQPVRRPQPESRANRSSILDDDDDYIPVRRVAARSGFIPFEQRPGSAPAAPPPMRSGFRPNEQLRGRFTPIELYEPVRSGFTPLK